jgi:hypothetical protein
VALVAVAFALLGVGWLALGRLLEPRAVGMDTVTAETRLRFPPDAQLVGAYYDPFPWSTLVSNIRVPTAELPALKDSCGCEWTASGDFVEMVFGAMKIGEGYHLKWWQTPHPRHFLTAFRPGMPSESNSDTEHAEQLWVVIDLDDPATATLSIVSHG